MIMINDYDHYDDDNSNYDYSIIMIIHDTLLGNKVTQNLSLPMRGQDIDELFAEQDATPATPATVDYGEWKANVEELKRVLDEYDTKDSGQKVDEFCKSKLAEIRTSGEALIKGQQLSPGEEDDVREKISSLTDQISRLDTAVIVVPMK